MKVVDKMLMSLFNLTGTFTGTFTASCYNVHHTTYFKQMMETVAV